MKLLWTEEAAEFKGEFCSFPKAHLFPKPVQQPYPPIIFGGNSMPALRRAAEAGDGWFGWTLTLEETKEKIERTRRYTLADGRDPEKLRFTSSPGFATSIELDEIKRYRDAGTQQIILGMLMPDAKAVESEIERLAENVVVPAAKL
jgi:alkanesulfonate monooxygenase SsuD/methylene tetrahydromethanopterin reductase-like flavin-dependent oxidoreductase (luciferase family)